MYFGNGHLIAGLDLVCAGRGPGGGGGVLPYKCLMGTCGQPGYVFGIFVLNRLSILSIFGLNRVSFLGR